MESKFDFKKTLKRVGIIIDTLVGSFLKVKILRQMGKITLGFLLLRIKYIT